MHLETGIRLCGVEIGPELAAKQRRLGFEFIRHLEDGRAEIKLLGFKSERRMRAVFVKCPGCAVPVPTLALRIKGMCLVCAPIVREWSPWLGRTESVGIPLPRREYLIRRARVAWGNRDKINAIYERAKELTKQTGEPHEVDHFYPIVSAYACGLHVHENLRVIKRAENAQKTNVFPADHSPATRAAMDDGTYIKWTKTLVREFYRDERRRGKC